jgi:CheY-like chemotaxis protein
MSEQPSSTITREAFSTWVHDALGHLYDSPHLENHPLGQALLSSEPRPARRSQELRRILLAAIRSLHPEAETPRQSRDWRAYRLLELRFITGLTPAEVMQRLALGRSLYFQEQARMFDRLIETLWDQWSPVLNTSGEASPDAERTDETETEVERLRTRARWEAVSLTEVLADLQAMITPLAAAHDTTLATDLTQPVTVWRADRVLLRQVILSLVSQALETAPRGTLHLGCFVEATTAGINLMASTPARAAAATAAPPSGLSQAQCHRLLKDMEGELVVQAEDPDRWQARLSWPRMTPNLLLVIDDNAGLADLFRRYLAEAHWQVMGAANGAEARQVLTTVHPTVITLDVMLPQEDGWELLMALKAEAATRDIPVVVCSALNEPHLVTALGAAAYLPKPVTQPALQQALQPWMRVGASPEPVR